MTGARAATARELEQFEEELELVTEEDIDLELARKSLAEFCQQMWPVLEPGTPLAWGWMHDAICEHLEAVTAGEIRNLIINIPPRFLKSTIVSVMWPAWEWLSKPHLRYLTSSYDLNLATRDARRTRDVMLSPRYQAMITDPVTGARKWAFKSDQNVKTYYENDHAGTRICTAPSAAGTGHGGDRVMVDDPHNVKKAESDEQRQQVADWWGKTMSSRRNDMNKSARIIVMQRLHETDLTGVCLEKGGYDHLCLPVMYEPDHPHKSKTNLHFVDPREDEGELLMEERFNADNVDEQQVELGTYGFVGQYLQRPAPADGVILKKPWFRRYEFVPVEWDLLISSWDVAFKGKNDQDEAEKVKNRSWVVGQVWCAVGANAYLLDEVRGRWDILETIAAMKRIREKWPKATAHLMENKANGPAIVTMVRDKIPGVIEVEPDGSKVQRCQAVSPVYEAGNIWVPEERVAIFDVEDHVQELITFPFGKADDRVDCATQAVNHLLVSEVGRARRALDRLVSGM